MYTGGFDFCALILSKKVERFNSRFILDIFYFIMRRTLKTEPYIVVLCFVPGHQMC